MQSKAKSVEEYISELSEDRKEGISNLRKVILENLPKGFEESMTYGMIGYTVPHVIYPDGYHCDPSKSLPFVNIASQKNFIAFYHMGIYADTKLLSWFISEYPKYTAKKLDMGKSCVRFKKSDDIPYKLIGELISKISVEDWIKRYEKNFKKL